MDRVGAFEPLERRVILTPKSVNTGDIEGPLVPVIGLHAFQCCIGLGTSSQSVMNGRKREVATGFVR